MYKCDINVIIVIVLTYIGPIEDKGETSLKVIIRDLNGEIYIFLLGTGAKILLRYNFP